MVFINDSINKLMFAKNLSRFTSQNHYVTSTIFHNILTYPSFRSSLHSFKHHCNPSESKRLKFNSPLQITFGQSSIMQAVGSFPHTSFFKHCNFNYGVFVRLTWTSNFYLLRLLSLEEKRVLHNWKKNNCCPKWLIKDCSNKYSPWFAGLTFVIFYQPQTSVADED